MTVNELMERIGVTETGKAIAYIKDGIEEMNVLSETDVATERIDIVENQRFYQLPSDYVKILDIRCKNHLNSKDEYRSIPRGIGNIVVKDADGQ